MFRWELLPGMRIPGKRFARSRKTKSFVLLFVVVVVSILVSSVVFSFVDWRNVWVRIGLHLLLLVPVVGVTYEFNRYVGGHDNPVTNALAKPGLWLQNFTTNEPDDSMLEVAIRALELVIPEEKGKDAW